MLTGEVGVRMHITSGSVTSLLDNLEQKGLVERSSDPNDRRRVLVDVTPTACNLLDQLLPEVQQVSRHIFGPIGSADQEALLSILGSVRTSISEVPEALPAARPRRRP